MCCLLPPTGGYLNHFSLDYLSGLTCFNHNANELPGRSLTVCFRLSPRDNRMLKPLGLNKNWGSILDKSDNWMDLPVSFGAQRASTPVYLYHAVYRQASRTLRLRCILRNGTMPECRPAGRRSGPLPVPAHNNRCRATREPAASSNPQPSCFLRPHLNLWKNDLLSLWFRLGSD